MNYGYSLLLAECIGFLARQLLQLLANEFVPLIELFLAEVEPVVALEFWESNSSELAQLVISEHFAGRGRRVRLRTALVFKMEGALLLVSSYV